VHAEHVGPELLVAERVEAEDRLAVRTGTARVDGARRACCESAASPETANAIARTKKRQAATDESHILTTPL
jgi:hypothetical protein